MWPQIIVIILMSVEVGCSMMQHGEPKRGEYSVWSTILSMAVVVGLLYWGGFFDVLWRTTR